MNPVLIQVTPLSAEDNAKLVEASGGQRFCVDPQTYFMARDAKGWLVCVHRSDVLQPRDVAGLVGGASFDY